MVERFARGFKAYAYCGIVMVALGFVMALYQWPEFLRSGRVIVGYSSREGFSYGLWLFLFVPIVEIVFGARFLSSAIIKRIELSTDGLSDYNSWNRRVAFIPWKDVRTVCFEGTRNVAVDDFWSVQVPVYLVSGLTGELRFDKSIQEFLKLVRTIERQVEPAIATDLNDLVARDLAGSRAQAQINKHP